MSDRVINALEEASAEDITFNWYRESFKADNGLKDSLDWGHAVLDSPEKLDQYLYTYGPMIESQWQNAASFLEQVDPPTTLIDYGCGQGLAGLLVNDLTEGRLFDDLEAIALIEPSSAAIARAEAVYAAIAFDVPITSLPKYFNGLKAADLPRTDGRTLHIFSNSLDLDTFDASRLLGETLRSGRHTIVSVSHDRSFRGGTPKIDRVAASLADPNNPFGATVITSTRREFVCRNRQDGLAWYCELEIA